MPTATKSETVQVVLPAALAREAEVGADDAGLSLSAFLRMGIKEWLRTRRGDKTLQPALAASTTPGGQ